MKVVKYILGVFFVLGGIGSIAQGGFGAGLMMLILGIAFLPPVSDQLKEKFKFWQNKAVRYGSYVVLFIISGVLLPKDGSIGSRSSDFNEKTVQSKSENTSGVVTIDGNGNEVETKEVEKEEPKMKMDNSAFWNEFDPIVKERIHKLIESKDCAGLQQEFNNTADNMDRIQNAGGSGSRNLKLLTFLEDKMKDLDCY
ncbi:hypothetical protein [Corallibacter sp.]|uniref:hypothetical protein n=1 Tax=Corallibacter sp. TaxID=2038084 RepID=UPI003AB6207E